MSIPLVQEATKDAINTSIIAIKRNIERINMLLGLVDSGSPDLSGFATKQELQDAVNSLQPVDEVTLNNMQSVTSNAVAGAFAPKAKYFGLLSNGNKTFDEEVDFNSDGLLIFSLMNPTDTWVFETTIISRKAFKNKEVLVTRYDGNDVFDYKINYVNETTFNVTVIRQNPAAGLCLKIESVL